MLGAARARLYTRERVFIRAAFARPFLETFIMNCLKCKSEHVAARQFGKKTCTTVGFFTGAAAGAVAVLRGAQAGLVLGAVAGPFGSAAGGLAGAALAALFAGSAGGAVGSALGTAADETLLDNRQCMDCGFTFRDESGCVDTENPAATAKS